MEAYRALHPNCNFSAVFPVFQFKHVVKQLDFSLLRELLTCSGEVRTSLLQQNLANKRGEGRVRR